VINGKGFIFDYATQYAYNHPTLPEPKNFALTDLEYQDFINWMKNKTYTVQSPVEIELVELMEEAKKEKFYDDLKPQLDQIKTRLAETHKNDLMHYKDQLKHLLEKEIASRYYFEKGAVETGFKHDKEVKAAIEVLHNQTEYKRILKIP
jgi:carboxyl-terminal processing protease